ncbi:outer membrane beta-barrel protein [Sphingobacterium sp. 1.A.4]|uniref:outer membrane beta-barrel protein n=1 Tax=Sphingobacterium sp. 1.A.4 TaxID=2044603 RepID=UPI000C0BD949|nr:outer membrane beta-barrel protein [Sphingobacterium sp. 1.A.4]
MKYMLFLLIWLGLTTTIQAQVKLSGKITDKTKNEGLQDVTLLLLHTKDSTRTSIKSNDKGEFSFEKVNPGNYQLTATLLGFKRSELLVTVANKAMNLNLAMEPGEIMIEEIAITAPPTVAVRGDTMEFNAKNFQTREYADADEMVAQVPGVVIDENGNVKAHGEDVKRILVDGKEFFTSDPRIALKNLPADIIDKLQIIDERSEQSRFSGFDDGKRNKVINIVTKPDRRSGFFGRANAGKGDADKFAINTALNAFNGDRKMSVALMANNINETDLGSVGRGGSRNGNSNTENGLTDTYAGAANYTNSFLDKKLEVNANYNFRKSNTNNDILNDIEFLSSGRENQFQNSHNISEAINNEHTLGGRFKWRLDSMNNLDFNPNMSLRWNDRENSTQSNTSYNKTDPINNVDRSNDNSSNNFNFGGNLTYMHRFKAPGQTISLNIDGNKSSNDALGQTLAFNEYYRNAVLQRSDTINRQNATYGYGSGFNSRLSFTKNINNLSRLQANYGFRNTSNYSDRKTLEFLAETGQYEELNQRLSNEFRNDFNHHSVGLSYSYNKRDTLRIQAGLNYEHGVRVNDRTVPYDLRTVANFGSFLPNFNTTYFFTKERTIEFTYNTNTNVPSISDLQDYLNNENPLNISTGNPDLKQEYSHSLKLNYRDVNKVNGRSFTTHATFNIIDNSIVDNEFRTDTSIILFDDIELGAGGRFNSRTNVDGVYSLNSQTSYGLPIKKLGFNVNATTNLFYNKRKSFLNSVLTPNQTFGFSQGVSLNSNFDRRYTISVGYDLSSRFIENPSNTINPKYNIINHRFNSRATIELFKSFLIGYQLVYINNGAIQNNNSTSANSQNINLTLLNASLGYKFLRRKNAELSIKGFDLLNNAKNINRNVGPTSITNSTSQTLNRYFILNLTYNIRNFGGRSSAPPEGRSEGPRGDRGDRGGNRNERGGNQGGGFQGGSNRGGRF